jgi:hypothetical protein
LLFALIGPHPTGKGLIEFSMAPDSAESASK